MAVKMSATSLSFIIRQNPKTYIVENHLVVRGRGEVVVFLVY